MTIRAAARPPARARGGEEGGLDDRGAPEDRVALLVRDVELLDAQLLTARPVRDRLRIAREPVDRVHEQVLVAEVLDEEVARELRVAVDDEPALLRLGAWRREGAEGDLQPHRHRTGAVTPSHE